MVDKLVKYRQNCEDDINYIERHLRILRQYQMQETVDYIVAYLDNKLLPSFATYYAKGLEEKEQGTEGADEFLTYVKKYQKSFKDLKRKLKKYGVNFY